MKPNLPHDCDDCNWLGSYIASPLGEYAGKYDLYYHPGDSLTETVIARYGAEGSYYSGLHFAQPYTDITGETRPGIDPLVEARSRAIRLGLLKVAE